MAKIKGTIVVDKERCKGCGVCVASCPCDVLELSAEDTQPDANIPCVIISPIEGDEENPFKNKPLEDFLQKEDRHLWNFHRIAVPLPMLNEN